MATILDSKTESFLSPPQYTEARNDVDLDAMTPSSNGSTSSLPTYDNLDASSSSGQGVRFQPTRQLQMQTRGEACASVGRPDPIFIYEVTPDGQHGSDAYISLRFSRSSSSCVLVRAGDSSETPLCSTTYRIGPYRPPRMKLPGFDDEVTVSGSNWNCLSRKTGFKTPLGEFRWRYGGRRERKAVDASSLLVLERLGDAPGSDGKDEWRRVGQMVRNKEFRSAGTSRWSSGNGGRLMLDLSQWADGKGAAQQVEVMAVASCLIMLKKESEDAMSASVVVSA